MSTGRFYDSFPQPCEISMLHFKPDKDLPGYDEAKDAWWALFSSWDEWMKKDTESITESDVERWAAIYDKFHDIIKRGVKEEYQHFYI